MTTDKQVRRLMSLIKKGLPLSTAAVKAGMSEPTARKYRRAGKLPGQMKAPRRHRPNTLDPGVAEVWTGYRSSFLRLLSRPIFHRPARSRQKTMFRARLTHPLCTAPPVCLRHAGPCTRHG